MPEYRFHLVNVFTEDGDPLSGNPLCVFEDGCGLEDATMQALALQFNLSETTFLLPSKTATARVRIFTPSYEMPFAGHPTLGSAHVARALKGTGNNISLEMHAGVIPVAANGDRWTLTASPPAWRELDMSTDTLAAILGLEPIDIAPRPLWVNAGKEQLIVPLSSEAAVRRVQIDASAWSALKSEDGHNMTYVFADLGGGRVLARFFFPQGRAVLEDPATGSAAANLGGWYLAMRVPLPLERSISQGEAIGRRSSLGLDVDARGEVRVSGEVIALGGGVVRW
jgi:PhzF family phenazine biosynthesis protein